MTMTESGSATSYLNLLNKLVTLLTTANSVTNAAPGGGNVGDGDVTGEAADNAAPTETWTLTATSTGPGATFTVVGSVSGAKANATSAVAYDNGIVSFTITDGATPWAINDSFTFDVTKKMGEEVWTEHKNTTSSYTVNGEVYLEGPGLTGTDSVHVNIRTSSTPASSYYSWELNGALEFNTDLTYEEQLGSIPSSQGIPAMLLLNSSMNYRIAANGQRFVLIAYAGTVCESCYCGFINPYGSPTDWPFPLFIGACSETADRASSSTSNDHVWWLTSFDTNLTNPQTAHIRMPTQWYRLMRWSYSYGNIDNSTPHAYMWPHSFMESFVGGGSSSVVATNTNDYVMLPIMVVVHDTEFDDAGPEATLLGNMCGVGELDNVYWTIGFGLNAADTLTIGGDTYEVFQDTFRTADDSFAALKLE